MPQDIIDNVTNFKNLRGALSGALLDLISRQTPFTSEDLEDFCILLTDYLTDGVFHLGILTTPQKLNEFSDKYADGTCSDSKTFKNDLSTILYVLEERWEAEDRILARMSSQDRPKPYIAAKL